MDRKDWILLFVPILCNGIILFILEKKSEKRRLIQERKYKYFCELEQKLINCLAAWSTLKSGLVNSCSDEEFESYYKDIIEKHREIIVYCEQRELLLKPLSNLISELRNIGIDLKDPQRCSKGDLMKRSEATLKKMHQLCLEQA